MINSIVQAEALASLGLVQPLPALEEPITPPVKVEYTNLLDINGQFVQAASGKLFVR